MLSAKRTAFTLKAASLFFISTLLINIFTPSSFVFAAELSDVERLEVMKSLKNSSDKIRVKVAENYGNIPLSFEKNEGQHNEKVKFSSRGKGYEIFLAPTESILRLSKSIPKEKKDSDKPENLDPLKNLPDIETSTVRMKVVGANPNSEVSGVDKQITKTNYFSGRDKSKWRTNIANYGKVNFDEVYPGIDMVYYGKQKQLEYDFVVKPGVDYKQIKLEFEGADNISLDEKGNLILETKAGNITQHAPIVYQEIDGKKVDVEGRYVVQDENKVSFQVVEYDQEKTLIIDPVVEYVVEFGGNHNQWIRDIAVDSSGNMFVVGATMMGRWGGEQMVVGNYVQSQHQMLGNDDLQ